MEVYRHGISFKNPAPVPIPYRDGEPSFITYGAPATGSKGTFGTRKPFWLATKEKFYPREGFEMIKNTPEVDGLGAWLSPFRKRMASRAATGVVRAPSMRMADRKRALMHGRSRSVNQRGGAIFRVVRKQMARKNLGLSGISNMPTYGELALGEAQAPTAASGTVVRSGFTGFLQNLLTTGADIYKTQQESKVLALKSQIQAGEQAMMSSIQRSPVSVPMMLGIGGAALLAITLVMKKKRG